ncbi:MAG: PAS domain-containing protein [Shimia sp.]
MVTRSNIQDVVAQSGSDNVISAAMEAVPLAMVLTDPRQDDNPITFVNSAFEDITLYSRRFAVGRNCRFLQGEETHPKDIKKIRDAMAAGEDISLDIVNYKADGAKFHNRLMISPIYDDADELIAFVGVQRELTNEDLERAERFRGAEDRPLQDTLLMEVQHRVKNHLAMLVSLIRMQAGKDISRKSFEALSHRVRGLALLYDELSGSGIATRSSETVAAGAYISRIGTSLAAIEGQGSVRVNVDCDELELPVDLAARLGLLLTEFLTNALQHAFGKQGYGAIHISFRRLSAGGARLIVEDDGCGLPEGSNWPWSSEGLEVSDADDLNASGIGGSLIVSLAASMDAQIVVRSGSVGTVVTVDIPPYE